MQAACSSGAARLAFLGPPPSSPSCFSAGIFVTSSPKLLLRTACERPALHRRRSHRERWLELVVLFPSAAAAVAGGDASRFISMGQSKAGPSVAQADGTDCEACRRWRWRKEADCRVERSSRARFLPAIIFAISIPRSLLAWVTLACRDIFLGHSRRIAS